MVERDVAVSHEDVTILRAHVFRPDGEDLASAIVTLGPDVRGARYSDGSEPQWQ